VDVIALLVGDGDVEYDEVGFDSYYVVILRRTQGRGE
jgi:hypothetical protein